jgi:hypothetical protein
MLVKLVPFTTIKKAIIMAMLLKVMELVIGVIILIRYINLNEISLVLMGKMFINGFISVINILRLKKLMKMRNSN